jgi:L-ascorbate oxidase
MPEYLADLTGPFKQRTVGYEMTGRGNLEKVHFSINGKQYDPSCVNETLTLGVAEEWLLTNNSNIAHPFHIHTNPFQLIRERTWNRTSSDAGYTPVELVYNPPFVWRDTLAIPTVGTSPETDKGEAVMRYVAEEFTGEFVNHCHILGHEDRGMMQNVQAVCANGMWGNPTSDLSPECVEGNYTPAAPPCR